MRLLMINMLATAMLLAGATSASAWGIYMTSSQDGGVVLPSGTVTVNVFLDNDIAGLSILSVAVLADDNMSYIGDPGGTSPTYILYSSFVSKAEPAVYLTAANVPANSWGGILPPGKIQVNVDFVELTFNDTRATGLGIHLATLTFHVDSPGDGIGNIALSLDAGGNIFRSGGVEVPSSQINLGPDVDVITPEPTTALLVGLGLIGLGVAGRRRE